MTPNCTYYLVAFFILLSLNLKAQEVASTQSKLQFFGDFRFRGEQDWDSRRYNGEYREDRHRMRARLRFGFSYRWNTQIQFGARIRSGVPNNIQSPHFNVGYKGFSSKPFQLDRYYVKGTYRHMWWWMGKNGLPFWKQNELWWDDDVQPEGISFGLKRRGKK